MKLTTLLTPIIAVTDTIGILAADHHKTANIPSAASQADAKDDVTSALKEYDFATLVAASKACATGEKPSGKGWSTGGHRTNAAFGALPEGTVGECMKPSKKDELTDILWYHSGLGTTKAEATAFIKLTTAGDKKAPILRTAKR